MLEYSERPLVSVIMNCFNSEKYLREAIDSVLAQSYRHWELIIWDNCSVDATAKISKSYADERILYYKAEHHTALGEARNLAISVSHGDLIAFLDSDDVWLPEKLEKQVPLFNSPEVGLVICDAISFNKHRTLLRLYQKRKPPTGMVFRQLLGEYFVWMVTAMIRRKSFESLDYGFNARYEVCEEYDLFVRIGYAWELAYVDQVLAMYRVHGDSLTLTRGDLFPVEQRLILNKFKQEIVDFEDDYHDQIFALQRDIDVNEAILFWRNGAVSEARRMSRPYISTGFKWMAFYLLTYFPFSYFELMRRYHRKASKVFKVGLR